MKTATEVSRDLRFPIPEDPADRSRLQQSIFDTWKDKAGGPMDGQCHICGGFLPADSKIELLNGQTMWAKNCAKCDPLVEDHYEQKRTPKESLQWDVQCPALFKEILAGDTFNWQDPKIEKVVNWDPSKRGLYITGGSGSYKTTSIWALARRLEERHGIVPKLSTSTALARNLSLSAREIDSRFIEDCVRAEVLIIDDLGKEKFSETTTCGLYEIIDGRYYNRAPIVITSRYGGSALERRFDLSQDSNMGFDICRRIGDMVERVDYS